MAVENVGGITQTTVAQASQTNATNDALSLGKEDFLMLFMESLKNQDPMSPMDNAQMMQQLSQLGQMEAIANLKITVDEMKNSLLGSQIESGSSLLGKNITAFASDGSLIKGVAEKLNVNNGIVELLVQDKTVTIGQISNIELEKAKNTESL